MTKHPIARRLHAPQLASRLAHRWSRQGPKDASGVRRKPGRSQERRYRERRTILQSHGCETRPARHGRARSRSNPAARNHQSAAAEASAPGRRRKLHRPGGDRILTSAFPESARRATRLARRRDSSTAGACLPLEASVGRGWRESSKRSSASVGADVPFRGVAIVAVVDVA
jgi:hypothetical protein